MTRKKGPGLGPRRSKTEAQGAQYCSLCGRQLRQPRIHQWLRFCSDCAQYRKKEVAALKAKEATDASR